MSLLGYAYWKRDVGERVLVSRALGVGVWGDLGHLVSAWSVKPKGQWPGEIWVTWPGFLVHLSSGPVP